MKSERRHDLQNNELAGTLGVGIEKAAPYAQFIIGGVVIATVLALGYGVYSSFAKKTAAAAWTEYYFALAGGDAETFKSIGDKHPSSDAAIWGQQTAADQYLADGIDALYRDRDQAVELIQNAIKSYETVQQNASQPELRTRAALGLAQAQESLGELEKAKTLYQQVISDDLQPAITSVAKNRVAFIESQAGKDFYAWFDKLKPAPVAPPKMPNDLSKPPTGPDLKFDTPIDTSGLQVPKVETASGAPAAAPATESKPIEVPPVAPATPDAPAPAATEPPATAPASEPAAATSEAPAAVPAPATTEPAPASEAPASPEPPK